MIRNISFIIVTGFFLLHCHTAVANIDIETTPSGDEPPLNQEIIFDRVSALDKQGLDYLKRFIEYAKSTPLHVLDSGLKSPQAIIYESKDAGAYFAIEYTDWDTPLYTIGFDTQSNRKRMQPTIIAKQRYHAGEKVKMVDGSVLVGSIRIREENALWVYGESRDGSFVLFAHESASEDELYDVVFALKKEYLALPLSSDVAFSAIPKVIYLGSNIKKDALEQDSFLLSHLVALDAPSDFESYYDVLMLEIFSLFGDKEGAPSVFDNGIPQEYRSGFRYTYTYQDRPGGSYVSVEVLPDQSDVIGAGVESIRFISATGELKSDYSGSENIRDTLIEIRNLALLEEPEKKLVLYLVRHDDDSEDASKSRYSVLFASTRIAPFDTESTAEIYIASTPMLHYTRAQISNLVTQDGLLKQFKKATLLKQMESIS